MNEYEVDYLLYHPFVHKMTSEEKIKVDRISTLYTQSTNYTACNKQEL